MAIPTTYSSNNGVEASNTTTHTINLPPVVSPGQLLLAFVVFDGVPTMVWDNTSHGTWTALIFAANLSAVRFAVRAKVADGTEGGGTLSVESGASEQSVHRTLAIGDWEGTLAGGTNVPTAVVATTATPDPPAGTDSWGTVDRKTIAAVGYDFSRTVTAYPTDYNINQFNDVSGGGAGCGLGTCARNQAAAGSQNPGTFTIDSSDQCISVTIGVLGGTAGIPPASSPGIFGRSITWGLVASFVGLIFYDFSWLLFGW